MAYTRGMVGVPWESLKRWTRQEAIRIVEAGIVEEPNRYELVQGLLLDKHKRDPRHVVACVRGFGLLPPLFAENGVVLGGIGLVLSEWDEPEPDLLVVRRDAPPDFGLSDVLLVVEVAAGTLPVDTTVKAALYALHGIPEYLILDVVNRRAEIRRKPRGEDWGETVILEEDGEFNPLGASGPLRVTDLLAPPEIA